MGGIGGNFYVSMLNGTEAQSFGKDSDINSHLHRSKDLSDFKMGIQDTRFYYQDPLQAGQDSCSITLPYSAGQTVTGFGSHMGRLFTSPGLDSCPYSAVRSPTRSGAGQSFAPGGGESFVHSGKEVYPAGGDGYTAPFQHGYPRPPMYPLPGLQVSGKTQAVLNNYPLWAKFHKYQTEMIITKQGRRMFPFLSFNLSGLDPSAHYNVYVDVILADQHHWRYQGGKWVQCGKAEGNMPGNRMYMHPDSPNSGAHWMRQEISFGKLKLTNNKGSSNNVAQMIVLQSLHKYQPRLHVVEVREDGTEDPFADNKSQTFVFQETQFIAVTAYQNADITQLKIDHNPFAKGFRDNFDTIYASADSDRLTPSPTDSQQLLPGGCYHQPYLPEQYMSPLPQGRYFSRDRMGVGMGHAGHAAHPGQPKDPSGSPHSRWYLPGQQGAGANRLDFNSFDADYSGNGFMSYKPFPLQTSAHHALGYYQEHHPFGSSAVSAPAGGWGASRPPAPYLNPHPHPKSGPGLGWFRPVPADPRLHPSPAAAAAAASAAAPELQQHNPPLPLPPPPDKPKEAGPGEDSWLEPPSVKSVDSADSGLYEGAETKKRRVSPYASSTESSPPTRGGEACEKDSSSDAGYYGFYGN
ncbi:T-box transcription factor TBX21 isoform X2 [Lepisosteus oculatus]|uniref:T-box transcription factor TBX21 isoform X2 n=1 Tax=Lepisosteus oculatus TaxID=7918 RepID=UPI0037223C61